MPNTDYTPERRAAALPGSYYNLIITAHDLMLQKAWAEAAALLQRVTARISRLPAARRQPGSDLARYLTVATADLVTVYAAQGDYAAATDLCRQLQTLDGEHADHWRRRIPLLRIEQGEVAAGLADLQALAEQEPDNLDHWLTLAMESIDHNAPAISAAALQRAEDVAQQSDFPEAKMRVHFQRYRFYRRQGRWREAVAAWQTATAADEELRASTRETVVRMLLEADLLDEAFDLIDDADMYPVVADYYRALIAFRRGDRVRAQHLWRTITQADLGTDDINPALVGFAYCWLGEPHAALSYLLQDPVALREYSVPAAVALGTAWAMLGNLEAARADFVLALSGVQTSGHNQKISRLDRWQLENLVQDAAIKAELRPFFEA